MSASPRTTCYRSLAETRARRFQTSCADIPITKANRGEAREFMFAVANSTIHGKLGAKGRSAR